MSPCIKLYRYKIIIIIIINIKIIIPNYGYIPSRTSYIVHIVGSGDVGEQNETDKVFVSCLFLISTMVFVESKFKIYRGLLSYFNSSHLIHIEITITSPPKMPPGYTM